jgi:hypothetical protein
MALLSAWLFATLLLQALGKTHKPIGRGRQVAVVAIFGLLSFEDFDAFLQHIDLSFQRLGMLQTPFDRLDGLMESLTQHLFLVLELLRFSMFLVCYFPPGSPLCPELFQFFFLRHALTLAYLPLVLQLHSPTE